MLYIKVLLTTAGAITVDDVSFWLANGWRKLPAWRIDMMGEWEHPLTIQLAGSPDDLAKYLLTRR